ncbi:MAG: hypothetical protein AAF702_22850 [Chloroflexota bacterium]
MGRGHANTVVNLLDPNCPRYPDGETPEEQARVDDDPEWQFDTAKIQESGIDSMTLRFKDPETTYDYMSYCGSLSDNNVWTSPWTYSHIYSETLQLGINTSAVQTASGQQPHVFVSGLVFTDTTAVLDPLWVYQRAVPHNNPESGEAYCLDSVADDGAVLDTFCFDLGFEDGETGRATSVDSFTLLLPYVNQTAKFVFRQGESQLAEQRISANAPSVTITSPNGGENWNNDNSALISWDATDEDGDPLTFKVAYSQDGLTWLPLATAITEPQLIVDSMMLAGGDQAKIRVTASDGINTSFDDSDRVFSIDAKSPQVHILSPGRATVLQHQMPIILQGHAYDPEDGILNGTNLNWRSSRDGDIGTGETIQYEPSSGNHIVTLTATDDSGNSSTTEINIFVGAQTYVPAVANP